MPPLTWKVLGVPAAAGLLVVVAAWWMGPSLFGTGGTEDRRVVSAAVVEPVDCTKPHAEETVRFTLDGRTRDGTLSGCGHDEGEQVRIAVPDEQATAGEDPMRVHLAATAVGTTDLRRPVGLALVVLSCAGGGTYVLLVVRSPRRREVTL